MIDYATFCQRAAENPCRSVLMVRHGERPHLSPDDSTFGDTLSLTDAGRQMARDAGALLRAATPGRTPTAADWFLGASPKTRTRQTVALMAESMGIADPAVIDVPELGIPGIWMSDAALAHAYHVREGGRAFNDRICVQGYGEGYYPQEEIYRRILDWLNRFPFSARYGLFSTHDLFLALFLQGAGVEVFRADRWVGHLQGAALFEQQDGSWQVDYCVPDSARPFGTYFV